VMGFLGPTTVLAGRSVRPHDIEVLTEPQAGAVPAGLIRLVRLGFEVRAELVTATGPTWVQLTRGQADALDLQPDAQVWLRVAERAATVAAS